MSARVSTYRYRSSTNLRTPAVAGLAADDDDPWHDHGGLWSLAADLNIVLRSISSTRVIATLMGIQIVLRFGWPTVGSRVTIDSYTNRTTYLNLLEAWGTYAGLGPIFRVVTVSVLRSKKCRFQTPGQVCYTNCR